MTDNALTVGAFKQGDFDKCKCMMFSYTEIDYHPLSSLISAPCKKALMSLAIRGIC